VREARDSDLPVDHSDSPWEWDCIRIGNDEGKPKMRARKILQLLEKIDDEVENGEYDDVDSIDFNPPELSDYEESSDEELPSSRADPVDIKYAPWYSRDYVKEYRWQDNMEKTAQMWDEQISESAEINASNLLDAVRMQKRKAVRHLIKNKVDITDQQKHHLVKILGQKKESTFDKLQMLGDIYLENSKLEDAENMYRRAVEGFEGIGLSKQVSTLEAKHALGSVCIKVGKQGKAEKLFLDILQACDEKNNRKLKREPKKPTEENTRGQPNPAAKGNALPQADQGKSNEQRSNNKASDWHEVELDTVAGMSLLYADQGKLDKAAETYKRALKVFGRPPDQVEVFTYDWGDRSSLPYTDRNERDKAAEMIYHRALRKFESELGKEHVFTLTTALNLGINYSLQGKSLEAEELYRRACKGFEKELGTDHIMTLCSVRNLAVLLTIQHKLAEATPMHQQAIDGFSTKFGPEHPFSLMAMSNMGIHYMSLKEPQEAENVFNWAVDGFRRKFGLDHRSTLGAMRDLGRAYVKQGKFDRAEELFGEVLQRFQLQVNVPDLEKCYSLISPDMEEKMATEALNRLVGEITRMDLEECHTFMSLGRLYDVQGRWDEAEVAFRQCLQGYEKSAGPDAIDTLKATRRLGLLCKEQGKLDEAEEMIQQALDGFGKVRGPFHTATLKIAGHLSSLYIGQRKLDRAEEMYQRVFDGFEKVLGPDHQSTVEAAYTLGKLYMDQGKMKEAEKMNKRVLQEFEKTLGANHDSTLTAATDLGNVYTAMNRRDEAERMYRRAIEGFSKARGPDHLFTLDPLLRLGNLHREQHKLDDAEAEIQQALNGLEHLLGPDCPDTLRAVLSLGLLKHQQKRTDDAEKLIWRAKNGLEEWLGPDDISTLDATANLGYLYLKDLYQLDKAEEYIKSALSGYEKTLIPGHPSTLRAVNHLTYLYQNQGRQEESEEILQRVQVAIENKFGADHFISLMSMRSPETNMHDTFAEPDVNYQRIIDGIVKMTLTRVMGTMASTNKL
jgi:tetratricopeptide (TPR) repeat protein